MAPGRGRKTPFLFIYVHHINERGWQMSHDRRRGFKNTVLNSSTDKEQKKNPAHFEDEERYMAMVENIADGIAITVKTERVFVNRAFLAIHGLRNDSEVVGHPFEELVFREDREVVRERTLARQRVKHPDDVVECRIKRPDRDTDGAGFGSDDHLLY